MNEIKNQRSIVPIIFVLCLALGVSGQDWRKIIPLHTTCEEVKIILNVKECSIPVSKYKFSDIEFNINFSKGDDKWKVPRGTVTGVIVLLRTLPPLKDFVKDFNANLEDFKVLPDDDLPNSKIYENDERGISIAAQKIHEGSDEEYVTSVQLYPPKPKKKTNPCSRE